jgi:hypothetical protein
MYLHKTIETDNGAVEFDGEFSPEEVQFLLEYALNSLIQKGLVPFVVKKPEDMATVAPAKERMQ